MEVSDLACTWTKCLNLVDFEGVPMGMFDSMGFRVPFTWSTKVIDVDCAWVDHLNLLDIKGLLMGMISLVGSNLTLHIHKSV